MTEYHQRPHDEVSEKLYWGLVGHDDEPPGEGELADLSPIEIYNYAAASLSSLLNRPAPLDEIASVIVDAWDTTYETFTITIDHKGEAVAKKEYLSILLGLAEAWLIVAAELGVRAQGHPVKLALAVANFYHAARVREGIKDPGISAALVSMSMNMADLGPTVSSGRCATRAGAGSASTNTPPPS